MPQKGRQPNPTALKSFLKAHLAGFKVPKEFIFEAELLKSNAGKLLKREIRNRYGIPMDNHKCFSRRLGFKDLVLAGLGCFTALLGFAGGVTAAPEIKLEPVITGLDQPVAITNAADGSDRLFITLVTGQILIFDGQQVLAQPFLDISPLITVGGERGLFAER